MKKYFYKNIVLKPFYSGYTALYNDENGKNVFALAIIEGTKKKAYNVAKNEVDFLNKKTEENIMMKTSTNKEAYRIWKHYENSRIYSVNNAYKTRPSIYKERAENDIIREMVDNNGYCYRIISSNGFMFTCGYMMNTENGTVLVYHTKTKRVEILCDSYT